jgi:hypothetical protein
MSKTTWPVIATSDPTSREILSIPFEPYPTPETPPTPDLSAASESDAAVDAKPTRPVKPTKAYKMKTSKSSASKTVKVTKTRTSKFFSKHTRRNATSFKSALVLHEFHNKEGMAPRYGPRCVQASPETSENEKIFKEQRLLLEEGKAYRSQWILNNQKRIQLQKEIDLETNEELIFDKELELFTLNAHEDEGLHEEDISEDESEVLLSFIFRRPL